MWLIMIRIYSLLLRLLLHTFWWGTRLLWLHVGKVLLILMMVHFIMYFVFHLYPLIFSLSIKLHTVGHEKLLSLHKIQCTLEIVRQIILLLHGFLIMLTTYIPSHILVHHLHYRRLTLLHESLLRWSQVAWTYVLFLRLVLWLLHLCLLFRFHLSHRITLQHCLPL